MKINFFFLFRCNIQSVGLVVGAAMNVQNGVFLAPVMSVPFLLFSGFFVSFDAIPIYLRWITYLSYIRYGFEGTALATYSFGREKLKCHQVYCHFKSPETTLEELDMLDANFTLDIVALVVIFVVLRVAAYLFLSWKLRSSRWGNRDRDKQFIKNKKKYFKFCWVCVFWYTKWKGNFFLLIFFFLQIFIKFIDFRLGGS